MVAEFTTFIRNVVESKNRRSVELDSRQLLVRSKYVSSYPAYKNIKRAI